MPFDFRSGIGVNTGSFGVDRLVLVTRGKVSASGQQLINLVLDLDYLRGGVDHITIVGTGTRVDLQICPNDSLFVEKGCQDLLHNLILHIEDLGDYMHLVTFISLLAKV